MDLLFYSIYRAKYNGVYGYLSGDYQMNTKEKRKDLHLPSFELLTRLELVTSSLPRKCSTTELQQH